MLQVCTGAGSGAGGGGGGGAAIFMHNCGMKMISKYSLFDG